MLSSEMAMRNFLGTSSANIFLCNDLSYRRLVFDDSEDEVADEFVDDLEDEVADEFVDDLEDEEVFDEVEDDAVENVSEESVGVGDGVYSPNELLLLFSFTVVVFIIGIIGT